MTWHDNGSREQLEAPPSANGTPAPLPRRRSRLRTVAWGVVLGGGLGLAVVAVVLWKLAGPALDEPTAVSLAAAERLWASKDIRDYDLTVVLSGRREGVFELAVRGGQPVQVTLNGVSPRRGTWETWTVPGQFDTLDRELANAADPVEGFGAPPGAGVRMRVEFDREFGFPRRYERYVLGTPLEVVWEVTRFTPVASR